MFKQFSPCLRLGLVYSHLARFAIIIFLSLSVCFAANAKMVLIGKGSGSISRTLMGSLNKGDTLAIRAGNYSGGATFANLHDITIINYGGVVTFTGPIDFGGLYSGGTFMHHISWKGTGDPDATYGFVFSGVTTGIAVINFTANLYYHHIRFDHFYFKNCGIGIDIGHAFRTYTGVDTSFVLQYATFSDMLSNNSDQLFQGSWNAPSKLDCLADSIDMHNLRINNLSNVADFNAGVAVSLGASRFNIYNNRITYNGPYAFVHADCGAFMLTGNGQFHHNYHKGGHGYIARIRAYSMKPQVSDVWIYNNIDLATWVYPGFDISSSTTDYGVGNAYLGHANLHLINNTVGNKGDDWNYVAPLCTVTTLSDGATCEVRNNLAFACAHPSQNHLVVDWSGSNTVTTSNNLYFDSAHILGSVLSDTVNGFIAPGSPLIDAGFTIPTITTDFAGIPRPQGTAYDIGAREYSASASFAIANAGNNNTITLPSSSVTLNGSTSYAINSTLTYYLWTEISGPNTAVLSKPDSSITQVTGLILGTYVFSLKVKDANNDSSYATVSITVNAANLPPVVNAGINQTITLPTSTVTLSGSATDATGVIISHIWSQISGPNTSAIASASSYSTNVSSLIAGTYVFQLQATDNNSLSGTSTVSITVNPAPNQPPVVNAGTSQTIVLPTSTTTLSGSTTDATGTVVSYLWTQQSGPNTAIIGSPTTITTGISGLVAGVYVFQLKATDNNNLSGSGTLTIHVNPAAVQPPVANAGLNQTITLPTNFVSLNGTASYDPAGSIVSYSWSQISGPSSASISGSNSATASGSALVQGVYIFELTVLNNGGASSSAQVTVTVNNVANPIANAGTDQTITLPDNSVSLNGSQSYVPNGGTIASYNWVQTSGSGGITITNATTATPQASGLQVGQYVFQLTVTNSLGISSSAQVTITVLQGNLPPVANAGNDTTIALPTTSITLDGSTSYAPSGSIITYLWSQLQGPNNAVFASVNTPITSVYGLQPGIYKFQLMVTDNNGISVTSTVSDTVIDNLRTSSSASLLLYPNPTSNNLNLQISNDTSGTVLVFVYDMLGNMVMTNQFTKQSSFFSAQINVSSLRSGTYTLQTILGNKSALITKFVKQ